jgi:alpha-mannosidase
VADTHFDVLERPIAVPDSTGWVEAARGMQPLQTFAGLSNGEDGLAVLPRGLFEYEVFDDATRTLALTLLRACRIKLAVSEEKQTVLPDRGVQCPGPQRFEYAVCAHAGDWQAADLPARAADYGVPVRAVMTGRGKGALPLECSLFTLEGAGVQVTAVKQAEDGHGLIVRLLNPLAEAREAKLTFGHAVAEAALCRLDEGVVAALASCCRTVAVPLPPKKIATVKVKLARGA